jgi:hypothetical protein
MPAAVSSYTTARAATANARQTSPVTPALSSTPVIPSSQLASRRSLNGWPRLIDRAVFYYVPVSEVEMLSSPRFVGFWIEQTRRHRKKHKIAILEDAEELLLPRDAGTRDKVSNLLNLADGFLGDHLKLHVIATTNSPERQLDPALLRPGRLMGTREFRRLSRPEAQRLAKAKGLALSDQPDYSLAELYCGAASSPAFNADRQIGFAQ